MKEPAHPKQMEINCPMFRNVQSEDLPYSENKHSSPDYVSVKFNNFIFCSMSYYFTVTNILFLGFEKATSIALYFCHFSIRK